MLHEIRILLDDLPDLPRLQKLLVLLAQMQDHVGAALVLGDRLDGKLAMAVRFPADAFFLGAGHARNDRDLVGHHERGIKADAELADQLGPILGLRFLEAFQKSTRAGFGDGAEVFDDGGARHADAVVGDRQGPLPFVRTDRDLPLGVPLGDGRVGQRLEAGGVDGIAGIADKLAQEDVLVRIKRMDD